jgi:YVTN family beta-propeller protein
MKLGRLAAALASAIVLAACGSTEVPGSATVESAPPTVASGQVAAEPELSERPTAATPSMPGVVAPPLSKVLVSVDPQGFAGVIAYDSSGSRVWVTVGLSDDNGIQAIDLPGNALGDRIGGFDIAADIAIVSGGQKGYVSDYSKGFVGSVDFEKSTVTQKIQVGGEPREMVLSPDERLLYVAIGNDRRVAVIDTATDVEVGSIGIKGEPQDLVMSPDGASLYVATADGMVDVVDPESGRVLSTIAVQEDPVAMAMLPDGSKLFVVNRGSNTVSVIDTAAGTVINAVSVGDTPQDIAVTADGALAYVPNSEDWTVSVVDTSAEAVTGTIDVKYKPYYVLLNPEGNLGYLSAGNIDVLAP